MSHLRMSQMHFLVQHLNRGTWIRMNFDVTRMHAHARAHTQNKVHVDDKVSTSTFPLEQKVRIWVEVISALGRIPPS